MFIVISLLLIINDVMVMTSQVHPVLLYTDLVEMIATDGNCSTFLQTNVSRDTIKQTTQIIRLSQFSFRKLSYLNKKSKGCNKVDIFKENFGGYEWICFSTGNGSSITGSTKLKDTNWVFVNCESDVFISRECLNNETMAEITSYVCTQDEITDTRCQQFSMVVDDMQHSYRCSNNLLVEKQHSHTHSDSEASSISPYDLAAYLCAVFIFVSFLLAVFIPARKCKPNYESDRSEIPRIPLSIYEMYGVFYKPSAKRKLTSNVDKWKRRMSKLKPHSSNLALVANLKDLKRKASKGINLYNVKKSGKHVTIADDVNVYKVGIEDDEVHDHRPITLDSINLSLYNKGNPEGGTAGHHVVETIDRDQTHRALPSLDAIGGNVNNPSVVKSNRKISIC